MNIIINQVKQLILLSEKYLICPKRKTERKITLVDLKRCPLKHLNMTRLHEMAVRNVDLFDQIGIHSELNLKLTIAQQMNGTCCKILIY